RYQIGRHANETLALRYGIANEFRERRHNGTEMIDSRYIRLRKLRVRDREKCRYEVELSDFRKRNAIAVIEPGTEYVKTFYPMENTWFNRHKKLEEVLKGNRTMTLKEIAKFHIDKTIT
uniref:hypothetical protein n=1 Tax=Roseobacter sp. HKCCA0434 TaxID=3079297 RepID=UPI0029058982